MTDRERAARGGPPASGGHVPAPVGPLPAVAGDGRGSRRGGVGLLGGTFDPPHVAHLAVAEEAREILGLERIVFVPAGDPWQKVGRAVTPGPMRLELVQRAVTDNPFFAVDRREIDRPGPSYTADTLAELAAEGLRDPWLIVSAEALAGLATWHEPERVVRLARFCVVPRPGGPDPAPTAAELVARYGIPGERVAVLAGPLLAISSTALRSRVRAGRSIRYLVPDAVLSLVREYALYRADAAAAAAPAEV